VSDLAIRLAETTDLPHLAGVERAAGQALRGLDMDAVADDEPLAVDRLHAYQQAGRAWVTCADGQPPVAYLLLDVVDGDVHIEQVSVHPDCARRGLGRRLIDEAEAWSRRRALHALTLTTFSEVPWNAPYYRRLGFVDLEDAELGPGLAAVRRHEAETGLDAWPRVAMRRLLVHVERWDGRRVEAKQPG